MNLRLPIAAIALCCTGTALAADATPADGVHILEKFDDSEIDLRIDGRLDEAIWSRIAPLDDMVLIEPDTLEAGEYRTLRRLFYTDKGLYVGVVAEQPVDSLIARLSSRDKFIARDDFSFTLDPGGQGLYGYWFGLNLGDSIEDGTVLPERQFSNQWDGPWRGATAETENGWSGEMFLPWSMMTMPDSHGDTRQMGYYISRYVAEKNERWAYPSLPPTRSVFLSELQKIQLEGIDPRQQFTFYPFAAVTWDNELPGAEDSYKAGFDVFWRPTTNLQLTATVNPDFGNVESDNVVVNFSSFEVFFPEKRAFFLEGYEIFQATPRARGRDGPPTTLVNTRRIGSAPIDPGITDFELSDLEANQPSELIGAAKVTGQQGKLRYGILGAFEDDTVLDGELNDQPFSVLQDGRQFGVARVLYEDTDGGGRRAIGWMSTLTAHPQEDATTHGMDFHYLTQNGKINVDGQLLASDVGGAEGYGGFVDTTFTPRRGVRHELQFEYFDDQLDLNDLGFLRRNDVFGAEYQMKVTRSDLENFRERRRTYKVVHRYNGDDRLVNAGYFFEQDLIFKNNHFLFTKLNYFPKRWDDVDSEGNGSFRVRGRWDTGFFYETDSSKKLQFGTGAFYRQEDMSGAIRELELSLNWRPSDRFSVEFFVNYQTRDGWLIHRSGRDFTSFEAEFWRPRINADFFLTARQQFRVTMQWAGLKAFENSRWQVPIGDGSLIPDTQPVTKSRDFSVSRMTFQARYRWEIAPLSDLFVVYTRGADISSTPDQSFQRNFRDALTRPIVDVFVVKLRYRLGN